jgi:FMN phosphatase YigB (HAD superfamily)
LTALSASPEVTLFIDDTPGHVRAAEALGMTGHVHTGSASTIARIEGFLATGEFPADGQKRGGPLLRDENGR